MATERALEAGAGAAQQEAEDTDGGSVRLADASAGEGKGGVHLVCGQVRADLALSEYIVTV